MKIFLYILALVMLLSGCKHSNDVELQEPNYEQQTESELSIEVDENGEITDEYALFLLNKKTAGKEMTDTEEKYINYFYHKEDGGVAILDLHCIGMHKNVAQVYFYSTTENEWQHFEEIFLTTGSVEYSLESDGLVILVRSNVTEGTTEKYLIPVEDIFE